MFSGMFWATAVTLHQDTGSAHLLMRHRDFSPHFDAQKYHTFTRSLCSARSLLSPPSDGADPMNENPEPRDFL